MNRFNHGEWSKLYSLIEEISVEELALERRKFYLDCDDAVRSLVLENVSKKRRQRVIDELSLLETRVYESIALYALMTAGLVDSNYDTQSLAQFVLRETELFCQRIHIGSVKAADMFVRVRSVTLNWVRCATTLFHLLKQGTIDASAVERALDVLNVSKGSACDALLGLMQTMDSCIDGTMHILHIIPNFEI